MTIMCIIILYIYFKGEMRMKKGVMGIILTGMLLVGCDSNAFQADNPNAKKEPEQVEEISTDNKEESNKKTKEVQEETKKNAIKFNIQDVTDNYQNYVESKKELYIEGKIKLIKVDNIVSQLIVEYEGNDYSIDLIMVDDSYKDLKSGDVIRVYGTIDPTGGNKVKLNSSFIEKVN